MAAQTEGERLLDRYVSGLQFPEWSSARALELLEVRSSLALWEPEFGDEATTRLADADDVLLRLAPALHEAVTGLGSLQRLRDERHIPPGHWWWELDRLS